MAVWKSGSYAAALLLARKQRLEMRGAGRFEARSRLALVRGRFGDFSFFSAQAFVMDSAEHFFLRRQMIIRRAGSDPGGGINIATEVHP